MKFINYLKDIAGVEIFPMISLLIFFIFFVLLIAYVFLTDKNEILAMKNLPLDQNED
ncbi:MAG: CcoQ/FixQ family Cbb3-type cytochrome c oxidase assembly chaperone [Bacteroidetes bacterium]|nr:CcoQ/FixQ family Cbb3-type cytochrome c oxidase assembly chaperone [Bacteroidota bacterium]